MSINNRFAVDQNKTKRYGQYYGGIDFEVNEDVSAKVFANNPSKPPVGEFIIGNRNFEVTIDELELIEQTAKDARETIMKRYRLGLMGHLS